jgi:hypothetical protein
VTTCKKKQSEEPKKKKSTKEPVNEDGFPLKFCTFETLESRMMYRPLGYAEDSNPNSPYCCSCKLQPCIAEDTTTKPRSL